MVRESLADMTHTSHPDLYFIGWDVGGWNCDKNQRSRDAIVILDSALGIVGKPWRGNLRAHINEATTTADWIQLLFKLCDADHPGASAAVTMAIDTPLGFSEAFVRLVTSLSCVEEAVGCSSANHYLFRQTERHLFQQGLKPLSAIKDMLGSQATKGMHVLAKFAPKVESCGVWTDGNGFRAIEAYPAACRKTPAIRKLLGGCERLQKDDLEDARTCALIAYLFATNRNVMDAPGTDIPLKRGLDLDSPNYQRRPQRMKISTILDHIDNGHMALPEFQRGYVWNRDQVRGLFDSLYRRHPIGGLLVWATESKSAAHRGDGPLAAGVVKLLLDGQQRMTSLYGVARGRTPKFFDGNAQAFTGLRFHLDSETFGFYQPVKMKDDPLWIDVTELLSNGQAGHETLVEQLAEHPAIGAKAVKYSGRISRILGILEIELHIEEVTGTEKTIDVVVDIFNRVNSGGTKLSKGDLALAKICADWPAARDTMKAKLREWAKADYHFNLDWLLRSVNTALTGEAKFQFLHEMTAEEIQDGLKRATKHIDKSLNLISGRLGLDHDQVFFGRFGVPVMVRYLDKKTTPMNAIEQDKLLFWFVQAGMWGRFSGSTESFIDQDLAALEGPGGGLDKLLDQLRLWHGGLRVEPGHFTGWSFGARFYPVLYMLTRMGAARDWGTGLPLKASLLGKMSRLEVHHIFPKAQLYKHKFKRAEVNALGNFCFLTKDTNLDISDRLPEEYFPAIEKAHPGALASQWIPMDPELWKIKNFRDFLEARKDLLAAEVNQRMEELLHGETRWLSGPAAALPAAVPSVGGITSESEEEQLETLNHWMEEQDLPPGIMSYDFADAATGDQKAVFDLAWPSGIQEELSQPVAVLLNESQETLAIASQAGFRFFTTVEEFQNYVKSEILAIGVEV